MSASLYVHKVEMMCTGVTAPQNCPDFRASRVKDEAMSELTRILRDPIPPLGRLYGEAPTPPPHFHPRPDDMTRLAGSLLIHLREPAPVRDAERVPDGA